MTINVLVTGSGGFIGSALVRSLADNSDVKVLKCVRETPDTDLREYVKIADVLIHLAGEVRPDSSEDSFKSSHTLLTQKLINYLDEADKTIPVLMTSSIHAENPKNHYGSTKRECEIMLENFAEKSSSLVNIFRLTHIFGPGCKPNYNSVLTTWIYNLINDIPVNVYDRDIKMRYTFINDVVAEIKKFIFNPGQFTQTYRYSDTIYSVTLGQVIDLLFHFHRNENLAVAEHFDVDFISKLKLTYLSYLPLRR